MLETFTAVHLASKKKLINFNFFPSRVINNNSLEYSPAEHVVGYYSEDREYRYIFLIFLINLSFFFSLEKRYLMLKLGLNNYISDY